MAGEPPAPAAPSAPKLIILPANRLEELSGHTLSHFKVGPLTARGQSGLVFQAHNFKDDTAVALKVLWPAVRRDNREMRRFVRAMKTMIPLNHPNLVKLRAAGKTGPYCWVAMEYVEGESLTQVIQRIGIAGMLDWRHAFRTAVHIGQALKYAHDQSIIHRNLTPQNILVRSEDKVTKLGDLMLAKALEGKMAEQLTKPGELLGDIRYMAPERAQGSVDLDGRSDLYSLGALLYALLTGRPPFEGGTIVETLMKIVRAEPVPPKKFQMSIPDRFQAAVMKLLAKQPGDRFQTADELLLELKRIAKFHAVGG
jgi:serine/threonine protein kinase